jgi:hypothetical protein
MLNEIETKYEAPVEASKPLGGRPALNFGSNLDPEHWFLFILEISCRIGLCFGQCMAYMLPLAATLNLPSLF